MDDFSLEFHGLFGMYQIAHNNEKAILIVIQTLKLDLNFLH